MSTNTKLSYLNETKSEIKKALNNLGSSILDSDSFRSYVEKINSIYNEWEKVEGTGTNITLTPTKVGKMIFEYNGITYQESSKGINLYNVNGTKGNVSPEITIENNDYVTCNYNNSSGSNFHYSNFMIYKSNALQTSTNYLIVAEIKSISGTGRFYPFTKHNNSCIETTNTFYQFSNLSAGDKILIPVTTKSSFTSDTKYDLRTLVAYGAGESGSIIFRLSLLSDTTITSDTFEYEKYTNGYPSPSYNYRQDVKTSTGLQSLTISNEDNTQTISKNLNLGNIELCEIETYKDEIKKINNKWHIIKKIKKLDMSTITGWAKSGNGNFYKSYFSDLYGVKIAKVYSNIFDYSPVSWSADYKIGIANSKALWITTGDNTLTNENDVPLWLGNKSALMYAILENEEISEITDSTLLSQLEEIDNLFSFDNETNIVITGSEPATLNIKALKKIN